MFTLYWPLHQRVWSVEFEHQHAWTQSRVGHKSELQDTIGKCSFRLLLGPGGNQRAIVATTCRHDVARPGRFEFGPAVRDSFGSGPAVTDRESDGLTERRRRCRPNGGTADCNGGPAIFGHGRKCASQLGRKAQGNDCADCVMPTWAGRAHLDDPFSSHPSRRVRATCLRPCRRIRKGSSSERTTWRLAARSCDREISRAARPSTGTACRAAVGLFGVGFNEPVAERAEAH